MDLKFKELPDFPKEWLDFTAGVHPLLPLLLRTSIPDSLQSLHAHLGRLKQNTSEKKRLTRLLYEEATSSDRALKNIQYLEQHDAVAVIANIEPDLLGGTISQFLKCLTAVKICNVLAAHAISAVPVCWIHTPVRIKTVQNGPVRMPGADWDLHRLYLQMPESELVSSSVLSGPATPFNHISELIAGIEEIGGGLFDSEILDVLKKAYSSNAGPSQSCTRIFSDLLDEWGMIVIDSQSAGFRSAINEVTAPPPDRAGQMEFSATGSDGFAQGADSSSTSAPDPQQSWFLQNRMLPVFASVLGPAELDSFIEACSVMESRGMVSPIAWPVSSATLIDAGSRRILNKYRLSFQDLFAGEAAVLEDLKNQIPRSSFAAKLDLLESDIAQCMDTFNDLASEDKGFRKTREDCRKRILFQIGKTRRRVEETGIQKDQVMERQIHRVCCFLAPDGAKQECGLTGIYLPLRYSRTILSFLYESLDIMKFEHQLIYMD